MTDTNAPSTYFAPAERASANEIAHSRDVLASHSEAVVLLDALPSLVMVLNMQRQVIAVNPEALEFLGVDDAEALIAQRPGEAVSCTQVCDAPGGCGTSRACVYCGAGRAIVGAMEQKGRCDAECRILRSTEAGADALDLAAQAAYVALDDTEFVVLSMVDISGEKRRQALESVFFHDVLNAVTALMSYGGVLEVAPTAEEVATVGATIQDLAAQIADQIQTHRALRLAESGDLPVTPKQVSIPEIVRKAIATSPSAVGQGLAPVVAGPMTGGLEIVTDPTLLMRILGNLIKNAVEATDPSGHVTVSASELPDGVSISVNNPTAVPENVRQQIFQRGFSTKGGQGRGHGTYSVRLLTTRYLGGAVSFESNEADGTTFTLVLPREVPESQGR